MFEPRKVVVVQMSPRRAGQRRRLASPVMPEKMEEGSFSQPNINVWGSRLVAAPSSPTLERAVASPRTRGRQRSSHRAPLPFTPRLGASDLPAVHHYSPTRVPLAPPSLLTTIGGDSLRTAHNDNYAVAPSSTRWSSLSLSGFGPDLDGEHPTKLHLLPLLPPMQRAQPWHHPLPPLLPDGRVMR
jgi:hypothetical protein